MLGLLQDVLLDEISRCIKSGTVFFDNSAALRWLPRRSSFRNSREWTFSIVPSGTNVALSIFTSLSFEGRAFSGSEETEELALPLRCGVGGRTRRGCSRRVPCVTMPACMFLTHFMHEGGIC